MDDDTGFFAVYDGHGGKTFVQVFLIYVAHAIFVNSNNTCNSFCKNLLLKKFVNFFY